MGEDDVRERILNQAAESIMSYGIKRFTMDELAEKLGISKKTIYTFFRSKKELVEAVINREFDMIVIEQNRNFPSATTISEKIIALLYPVFRTASKISRITLEELVKYYPDIWKKIDNKRQERIKQMSDLMTREAEMKFLGSLKPEVVSNFILTSITGFITPENLTKMGITPAEAFKTVFTMIISVVIGPEHAGEFIEKFEQKVLNTNDQKQN